MPFYRDVISIFLLSPRTDRPITATTHSRATQHRLRCQTWSLRVQFPSCAFLKQKRSVMNGMNEKTSESHGYKRQLRLQKQRDCRARLACETDKRLATRAKQWSAKTSWAKSSYWRNKPESTEATQSSTAVRYQQTSVSNSWTKGSQAADQSEGNACRHEREINTW